MGDFGCGDGEWTPTIKIKGNKIKINLRINSLLIQDSGKKRQRGWAKSAGFPWKTSGVARLSSLSGSLEQTFTDILLKVRKQKLYLYIYIYIYICQFQSTFHYDSQFWRNRSAYNLPGGKTGFDLQETTLPTNWTTSLSKIGLGMKIDNQLRFIVINKQVDSLHSLIADGKYHNTSSGRKMWRTMIDSTAPLQRHCNTEGFNAMFKNQASKTRIGIIHLASRYSFYLPYLTRLRERSFEWDSSRLISEHLIHDMQEIS